MASNPSLPSNQEEEEDEEYHEEEDGEDEEGDDDFDPDDPDDEAFNAAVAASLAEAAADRDMPEVEILEVPPNQEADQEDEEEDDEGEGKGMSGCGSQSDRPASPNCPICLEPWTSDGPHRVCCISCGHVYGRSCLEKWLQRCRKSDGKCPQCNRKFKHKEIINLYAPVIVVANDVLEKEVLSLRENNETLTLENFRLQQEIKKHKMHPVNGESSGRQKMLCLDRTPSGGSQRRLCAYPNERLDSPVQTFSENRSISQNFCRDESRQCHFVLQKEFRIDGARVMGIDASSRILIISGKAPGVSGDHVLNKISLLSPNEIDKVHLPSNTGLVRDMRILSDGHVLLASLGKRLSLFSVTSNNCVLKYDLPLPMFLQNGGKEYLFSTACESSSTLASV